MSLRRKMGLQIAAIIVGMLLIAAAALWGFNGLRADYTLALHGYLQLRSSYDIGTHLATAQAVLQPDHVDRALALQELQQAMWLCNVMRWGGGARAPSPSAFEMDLKKIDALNDALSDAIDKLGLSAEGRKMDDVLATDSQAVQQAMSRVSSVSGDIRKTIETYQAGADLKRRTVLAVLGTVCGLMIVSGILLGLAQYRSVVTPLRLLSQGARRIAAAQFTERMPESGSEEFASLARDFNRMAEELDGFYHQLEQKVQQRSKELIRSERLASVGYLAAGVAHEINNPLGIIAGHAEYSLEALKQRVDQRAGPAIEPEADLIKTLQTICDEAFRCKRITEKLLSLARGGDETKQPVGLADLADQVVSIIGGLRDYRNRKLVVAVQHNGQNGSAVDRSDLTVLAVEAEMKQVLLNLTINALEATSPETGEVRIDVSRHDGNVELSVSDNGRGMTPQTLERVFEPFFTDKRGARQAGTGLGLSITHRIVESHGGTIRAESGGLEQGSRFIVRFPAYIKQEANA